MERPQKERLVGAAVLMAAAVILIPEMLAGPGRGSVPKQAATEAAPIKTYSIDLNQAPGASPPAVVAEETDRAPPPEESGDAPAAADASPSSEASPLAQPQTAPEIVAQTPAPAVEESTPAPARVEPSRPAASQPTRAEAPPAKVVPQPTRTETPPPKAEAPPARSIASAPAAPTSQTSAVKSGWAVQLGSYSSEATADRLRNEWRTKGLDAFVMPVKSGGKTLYRVRIGPTKDRAAADAALKMVKPSNPGAAVVAHP